MKYKTNIRWIIFIAIVVSLVIPFIKYFAFFTGQTSGHSEDWANFATFWAAFISLANTIAIIYLTYYFATYEQKRNTILERPIVSISINETKTSYKLSNIGKGAALNIRAYCSGDEAFNNNIFNQKRICYSLESNGTFERSGLNGTVIILEYTDIFNDTYYTMMENDTLYIFDHKFQPLLKSNHFIMKSIIEKFQEYMKWDRANPTWP